MNWNKKGIIVLFATVVSNVVSWSQNDTLALDSTMTKNHRIYTLRIEGSNREYVSEVFRSFDRLDRQILFVNGQLKSTSHSTIFNTMKTKIWNEKGQLTGKVSKHPYKSTTHENRVISYDYHANGKLKERTKSKAQWSCFNARGIYYYKVITFDERGKRQHKELRKAL